MTFDLSSIETQIFIVLGTAIGAGVITIVTDLWMIARKKLTVSLSSAHLAELDMVAKWCMTFAFSQSAGIIAKEGWLSPILKNTVAATATDYFIKHFPDVLARNGVDADQPGEAATVLAGLMARHYPAIAAIAAASPVMPSPPAASGVIASIVATGASDLISDLKP